MHEFSRDRVRRFRDKAEQLRAAASTLCDEQCRTMLLQIAQDYENLADAAETRSHASMTRSPIGSEQPADLSAPRFRREAS